MNAKLRKKFEKRKRRLEQRIDKSNWDGESPMLNAPPSRFDLAERQQGIAAGGIGMITDLARQLELRQEINKHVSLLKLHLPYDEADHVFNVAFNLLAGGTCLDHIELRRNDEAFLNAMGAQRIPDPTTAGDFCRRFTPMDILLLQEAFNNVRQKVWQQQPKEFFDQAIIEADGTMVETTGQCKEGIGMNYKRQWGYFPLVVTLANTGELLYVANRSGNRPSHEKSTQYFQRAVEVCREAGFRKVLLRGDTDFSLTEQFDAWTDDDVQFVFGMDAMPKLVEIAENLEENTWKSLERSKNRPDQPRQRPSNFKQAFVDEKGYQTKRLKGEWYAEFDYQPNACSRKYRVVVVYKDIEVTSSQQRLFDEPKFFFYVTNASKAQMPTRQVIANANNRCDQENSISQYKQAGILTAPLDSLDSNWAYMAIASLAWSLKCWSGLMLSETGTKKQKAKRSREKRRVIRMDFSTYLSTVILVPAMVIKQARQLVYRFLTWTPYLELLFRMHESTRKPLRC